MRVILHLIYGLDIKRPYKHYMISKKLLIVNIIADYSKDSFLVEVNIEFQIKNLMIYN